MAVDLRIMGFWRRMPVKPMSDALTPFAMVGLLMFGVSGLAMFAADPATLVKSEIFFIKLGLVALAVANALAFRRFSQTRLERWSRRAPLRARLSAAMSLSLWSAAIICGRMIAYQ